MTYANDFDFDIASLQVLACDTPFIFDLPQTNCTTQGMTICASADISYPLAIVVYWFSAVQQGFRVLQQELDQTPGWWSFQAVLEEGTLTDEIDWFFRINAESQAGLPRGV